MIVELLSRLTTIPRVLFFVVIVFRNNCFPAIIVIVAPDCSPVSVCYVTKAGNRIQYNFTEIGTQKRKYIKKIVLIPTAACWQGLAPLANKSETNPTKKSSLVICQNKNGLNIDFLVILVFLSPVITMKRVMHVLKLYNSLSCRVTKNVLCSIGWAKTIRLFS